MRQLVVGQRRTLGGFKHHLAAPLMDLGPLEGSPLFQPNRDTHRSLPIGQLLPLVWRLWWDPLVASGLACGHCLWAQPAVTPYFSPPLVAEPGLEPSLHREKVAPNCLPHQVKSQGVLFLGQ